MDCFDRAVNIINKAKRDDCLLGVFNLAGTIRSAKVDGELFRVQFSKKPEALIGCYDATCRPEWLEDDIEYSLRA